ncbi:Methyltransferase domain-containing protein [Rhodoblastus acidophilus]|uniref:Methyltransferase domain-containing protein n=1 Tax=Rhodoblastus acidophilus TaxID=1074 RepID=A0A212RQV9_RHOAC|nr:class I SAM-dependent methyltransferase [Rhodoblastus acidophilus]PPQ38558.1 class I SAM-dependent methyltransferase [Rhodoblastus acidophilus]RAI21871.1 class I SAM-dependent methyltransferase [Rhodoblastus acidophilus]SNB74917.1 Methyltransferase domain-containing protein [Rhodoblastus acidophilus]
MSQTLAPVESLNARKTYERIAFLYDFLDAPYEIGWKRALRRRMFEGLKGAILDAGVGTGCNFVAYPAGVKASGCDASAAMLERARARADRLGVMVDLRRSDLTRLDWADATFDGVVATFVFACIEDHEQLAALKELRRVCKPTGEIRIVDYRLSPRPLVRKRQQLMSKWLSGAFAASYTPTTEHYFAAAGLEVIEEKFLRSDVLKMIRLRPR